MGRDRAGGDTVQLTDIVREGQGGDAALTAQTWPIAAALLQFPAVGRDGVDAVDRPADAWSEVFAEVAEAGFDRIDLTDTYLRVGDLDAARRRELAGTLRQHGLIPEGISLVRRSVVDAAHGEANLGYSHRAIDAAAELGIPVVSVGLHQALTAQQREQLWFWTVTGHVDPDDAEVRGLAVRRLAELGRHAAETGVLLSLEMYEDTYLGSADSAVRLVEEIGSEHVGLNPDTGNLVRLHRPVEHWRELLERTLPYANYWHMKNYFRDEDPRTGSYTTSPAPLELGVIDYRSMVRFAIDAGYRGAFCMEHYGGDGLSVSATNREHLRRRLLPRSARAATTRSRVRQRGERGEPS